MSKVPELYMPVTNPIPWTSGKVRIGVDEPRGARLAETLNAAWSVVLKLAPPCSSFALRMIESRPRVLI